MPDAFQFKTFKINQDGAAHKVGIDGVLLGAWVNTNKAKTVLDIGSGTGLLALMMAQRLPDATIDAVEVDYDAFGCAQNNVTNSIFSERINTHYCAIQNFTTQKKYDLIISNPPYFSNGIIAPDYKRGMARHNHYLSQEELLEAAVILLHHSGLFSLILPSKECQSFLEKAQLKKLYLKTVCDVYPSPGKPANRTLLTLAKAHQKNTFREHVTLRDEKLQFSDGFKKLTADFYLNL